VATVTHGIDIASAVAQDNIWGVQFHPEKSSRAGIQLIKNFIGNGKC
jgi:glutamine amidotransferase